MSCHRIEYHLARWALAVAAAAVLVLSLLGCASEPTTVTVEVPVAMPCSPPPATRRPHLPAADLTTESPPADVMRAQVASLEALGGYCAELEATLDGYRQPTATEQQDSTE